MKCLRVHRTWKQMDSTCRNIPNSYSIKLLLTTYGVFGLHRSWFYKVYPEVVKVGIRYGKPFYLENLHLNFFCTFYIIVQKLMISNESDVGKATFFNTENNKCSMYFTMHAIKSKGSCISGFNVFSLPFNTLFSIGCKIRNTVTKLDFFRNHKSTFYI